MNLKRKCINNFATFVRTFRLLNTTNFLKK
jgi:hypothetical protein